MKKIRKIFYLIMISSLFVSCTKSSYENINNKNNNSDIEVKITKRT